MAQRTSFQQAIMAAAIFLSLLAVRSFSDMRLFHDGFESGAFSNGWSTYSTTQGRIRIGSEYGPNEGACHLLMDDDRSDGIFSLNEAVLCVDLAGRSNVCLRFRHKSFFDEDHGMPETFAGHCSADGVAVSSDGGQSWHRIQGLTSSNGVQATYRTFEVNLKPSAEWTFTTNFLIKFQQYDDSPIGEEGYYDDGFAFDEVSLVELDESKQADLSLRLTSSTTSVGVSNALYCQMQVVNAGPGAATGVLLSNRWTGTWRLLSASQGCEADASTNSLCFNLPDLPCHGTASAAVVFMPLQAGLLRLESMVSSLASDPEPTDNAAWLETSVLEASSETALLSFAVSDAPDPVAVSNELTYAISVTNMGPTTALDVVCLATLPENVETVSLPGGSHGDGRVAALSLGNLGPGDVTNVTMTVRPLARGALAAVFSISCDGLDESSRWPITNSTFVTFDIPWMKTTDGILEDRYVCGLYSGTTGDAWPALVDIDGDGDLDLFALRYGFVENKGNRTTPAWSMPTEIVLTNMPVKPTPAFCDIDADGDYDLFVGGEEGYIYFYENHGSSKNPIWGAPVTNYAGVRIKGYNLSGGISGGWSVPAFCDIDGDGVQDLFVAGRVMTPISGSLNAYGVVWYLHNSGTPASPLWDAPQTNYLYMSMRTNLFGPLAISFADVDNDGDNDAMLNTWFYTHYFENGGTAEEAAWLPPVLNICDWEPGGYFSSATSEPRRTTLGDIDGDGDFDMIAVGRDCGLMLYENDRTLFGVVWKPGVKDYISFYPGVGYRNEYSNLSFCDLDADGDQDMLFGNFYGLAWYENKGNSISAAWQFKTNFFDHGSSSLYLHHLCDVDADGDYDVLRPAGLGWVALCYSNIGSAIHPNFDTNYCLYGKLNQISNVYVTALCDIDADGDLDLFAGSFSAFTGQLYPMLFFENTGTAANDCWAPPVTNHSIKTKYFAFGDLDQDGDYDMVFTDSKIVYFVENTGTRFSPEWSESFTNSLFSSLIAPSGPALCDIDADGDLDLFLCKNNEGAYFFRNEIAHMEVTPRMRTVNSSDGIGFRVERGGAAWSFVTNRSGGSIDAVSGYYLAGAQGGLDVIEARRGAERGRVYVTVLSNAPAGSLERAVVIAGRNTDYEYDAVWRATDYLANLAYNALRSRGYAKGSLYYLSAQTAQDVDGNGLFDDIDALSSLANAEAAFTAFAAGASNLYVYLVDHGATNENGGYMRLNPQEVLTATNLARWLDDLQNTHGTKVTVVLDFCYAGSFLPALSYTGQAERVAIAACGADESAFFVAGGQVSFSEAFYNALNWGLDVGKAFELACGAMSDYQGAELDADQDGIYDKDRDTTNESLRVSLGGLSGLSQGIVQIGQIGSNQTLAGDAEAVLWASDVSAAQPIDRVWCVIVPPGYNAGAAGPVSQLPEVELRFSQGRYEGRYRGFGEAGTYKLVYYAHAQGGGVSLPKYGYVTQAGAAEEAVILSGAPTNEAAMSALGAEAYRTLRLRQLSAEALTYLREGGAYDADGDGTNDVDQASSLPALASAITNSASRKLSVYLAGAATNGQLRISETETLSAAALDGWLDAYQQSNRTVVVILEFEGSGAWVTNLVAPVGRSRVVIASTGEAELSILDEAGLASFSRMFWGYVFGGASVGGAFRQAREYQYNLSRCRQDSRLDDNANGLANEKTEGMLADTWRLGSAFVTGAETPTIGRVVSNQVATNSSVWLWAADIVAAEGLSNVWAVISPPGYEGDGGLEVLELAWSAGRYEALYTNAVEGGVYTCTFYARDLAGQVSNPRQSELLKADRYEPDNASSQAQGFPVGEVQRHNFHVPRDEDWVRFMVVSDLVYEVRATQLGTNVDTVMDIYYEYFDGTLTNVYHRDSTGSGRGQGEYALLSHWPSGFYCARIRPYSAEGTGAGSEYALQIYLPEAGTELLMIVGADLLDLAHSPESSVVVVDGPGYRQSLSFANRNNSLSLAGLTPGVYTITLNAPGYLPHEDLENAGEVGNPTNFFFGNPKRVTVRADAKACASFLMDPYLRVEGLVRDQWSGQRVEGVQISFKPRSGAPTSWPQNLYDGYPAFADYRTLWKTDVQGAFPTNVLLPPVDWQMTLSRDGYTNLVWEGLAAAPRGAAANLGTSHLFPTDLNADELPDRWANGYFAANTNLAKHADADGDGCDNWTEYLTGTDPNDAESAFLVFSEPSAETGLSLSWMGFRGHAYRILLTDNLLTNWTCQGAAWTNWSDGPRSWSVSNNLAPQEFYRVEEYRP
ncbi:MAG: hypothetical protein A2X46_04115 [Lentisphaerae bacterium GWF2_57_35]|nr:MAG: hypothetical protein A2X46_04115 [Lentisphaerae bacterium GWF2_57_35]